MERKSAKSQRMAITRMWWIEFWCNIWLLLLFWLFFFRHFIESIIISEHGRVLPLLLLYELKKTMSLAEIRMCICFCLSLFHAILFHAIFIFINPFSAPKRHIKFLFEIEKIPFDRNPFRSIWAQAYSFVLTYFVPGKFFFVLILIEMSES